MYRDEKQREHNAVVNQPYRTMPVVLPQPKSLHDYPTGSYMKYNDPNWLNSPGGSPIPPVAYQQPNQQQQQHYQQPDKLQQVMNQVSCLLVSGYFL